MVRVLVSRENVPFTHVEIVELPRLVRLVAPLQAEMLVKVKDFEVEQELDRINFQPSTFILVEKIPYGMYIISYNPK